MTDPCDKWYIYLHEWWMFVVNDSIHIPKIECVGILMEHLGYSGTLYK